MPLVERWLGEEHVAPWWREPIEEAIEKRWAGIEGRRPTRQFAILVDGRSVGMIQTYLVDDHPEWAELVQVGPNAAGVDLLIGESNLLGVGLGPRVLAEFARDVVFADPDVRAVVATVEEANRRSWRAFEKAGFRHVRDVEEDGLPHRLMRLDRGLVESYDVFPRIEDEFRAALDETLDPSSPDLLYDLVREMGLPHGSAALDVGCGEGKHAFALAERFGFVVTGVDPVARHVELASAKPAERVRFELGRAEALPVRDGSVDLVWCRDVLVLVADIERAYAEFHRVLRTDGRVLVFQMLATERLYPGEGGELGLMLGVIPASMDGARADAAIAASGLRVDERLDLRSEWGEWAEEHGQGPGRRLLHAARLLRDPERYVERFGSEAYQIMLGDCLWHVYAMIGKLERRVYVLTKP